MAEKRVTVATFRTEGEAAKVQRALEEARIDATIGLEEPGIGVAETLAAGGSALKPRRVIVQVIEQDVDQADAVINRIYGVEDAEFATPRDEAPPIPATTCPNCGSADIDRIPLFRIFALVALLGIGVCIAIDQSDTAVFVVLAAAIAMLIMPRWHCRDCGQRWRGYRRQL
jgi:hypothetical protein